MQYAVAHTSSERRWQITYDTRFDAHTIRACGEQRVQVGDSVCCRVERFFSVPQSAEMYMYPIYTSIGAMAPSIAPLRRAHTILHVPPAPPPRKTSFTSALVSKYGK